MICVVGYIVKHTEQSHIKRIEKKCHLYLSSYSVHCIYLRAYHEWKKLSSLTYFWCDWGNPKTLCEEKIICQEKI